MPKFSVAWFLLLTPLVLVLEHTQSATPTMLFAIAALAIIPIAKLLVEATEQIATRTGDAIGGLLNATFGNAPELIIAFVALQAGYLDMVKASIVGAILANLLFAQGLSLLLGGLRYHDQEFNPSATRVYSTMMMIAVFSMVVPSVFGNSAVGTSGQLGTLGIVVSVLLLATYALYLVFMLKTHPAYFKALKSDESDAHHEPRWSVLRASTTLVAASVLAAVVSEVLVGAAEGTGKALGMSQTFLGIFCLAVVGGIAEVASAVSMAGKNRMDLSIGIALGSSIQIALFVAPVLVLLSHLISPTPLDLTFNPQTLGFMLLSVLIGSMVSSDGKSNWFKGAQLLVVYLMLAVMVYLIP